MALVAMGYNNLWIIGTLGSTVVVALAYIVINLIANNLDNSTIGTLCLILAVICLIPNIFAIFAIFKLKGLLKLVPLFCLLVAIVVLGLSVFAYGFSGYGSY